MTPEEHLMWAVGVGIALVLLVAVVSIRALYRIVKRVDKEVEEMDRYTDRYL